MKNLLFKEIRLCIPFQTWMFAAFSMFVMIPSWPSLVAFVYPLAGFMTLFPIALANRDILYTSILPIKKTDVVKGKVMLVCFLQLASVVWSIPFGIVKALVLAPSMPVDQTYPELGVNFATYGFVLIVFAVFNIIFLPWYYKKPDGRHSAAQLTAMFVAMGVMGVISALFMAVPGWAEFINDFSNTTSQIVQFSILGVGIIIFLLFAYLCCLWGGKRFKRVNL